jgi:hypothetical protein
VKKSFISALPWLDKMNYQVEDVTLPPFREVNGHIHTPFSFSAFESLDVIFSMASQEKIAVLGINDFYVADGHESFSQGCLNNKIFPLFNIEFIGLLKEEQKKGIRINDPNNPGRIYFTGKGLDYPFNPGWIGRRQLAKLVRESQFQMIAMIEKLNSLISAANSGLSLSYEEIKTRFAKDLVRERHLAKAVRQLAEDKFRSPEEQIEFIEKLYGGKKSRTGISDRAGLENEIRSNLLKAGGSAFVPEDENSFLPLKKIIKLIRKAGGIPCYPVLLDDPSGKCTEFESDAEKLLKRLSSLGIGSVELIPGRNNHQILKDFVKFFYEKGFVITFGTEHNTPELAPLTVSARGNVTLDDELKQISWNGACVIAAHQYLRAHGRQGYVLDDGNPSHDQRDELSNLGRVVIEYYLNNK